MAWDFPKQHPMLLAAAALVVGVAGGALAVAAAASAASGPYLSQAQIAFRLAEEQQASKAWREGRVEAALGHAFCGIEAAHGLAAGRAFTREAVAWDVVDLTGLAWILHASREGIEAGRRVQEAEDRARLAVLWEKLGRPDAAKRELEAAVRIAGDPDLDKMRGLGGELLDVWKRVGQGGPPPEEAAPVPATAR